MNNDINRAKLTKLELIYPPISNQEAYSLKDDDLIKDYLKQSDFYMIGGKAELIFKNIEADEVAKTLSFDIYSNNECQSSGYLDLNIILKKIDTVTDFDEVTIKAGEKCIEFKIECKERIVFKSFTPINTLFMKSRYEEGIGGLDNYFNLLIFDLLYIGIAKTGDSYERLIKKGHQARQNILSNEPQRGMGSRVSDEIFLFLFKLDSLFLQTIGAEANFDNFNLEEDYFYDLKRIVADAEKAFIKILDPNYNNVKYKNYPESLDGLYSKNLNRYSYSINETLKFITPTTYIQGYHDSLTGLDNRADFISIDKETKEVIIFHAGQDFW